MGLLEVKTGEASISLQKPSFDGKVSVEKAIKGRRTVRDFRQKSLSLNHLSQLVWSGQGITDSSENKRGAASAGALYPLDLYILIGENGVEKMEGGGLSIFTKGTFPPADRKRRSPQRDCRGLFISDVDGSSSRAFYHHG